MLAKLTPQETCRNMEVFPVVVAEEEEAIYVMKDGSLGPGSFRSRLKVGRTRVWRTTMFLGSEPRMYTEDGEVLEDESSSGLTKLDPATVAVSIAGVAALAVGGTATCLYLKTTCFWVSLDRRVCGGSKLLSMSRALTSPN